MNRRILAVLLAVVLAVAGGALVITYARNADARAIAAESPTAVYVAQALIPAGTTLKDAERQDMIAQTAVAAKAQQAKLSAHDKRILEASTAFGRARLERHREQLERIREVVDTPMLQLPRLPTPAFGRAELSTLADALTDPSSAVGES